MSGDATPTPTRRLERFDVAGDGVSLHVTAAGPVDAPVVVLVHGYPDTSRVWYGVIDALADRYRVVAYDVRGMGASGTPADRRTGWRMEHLCADFAAVVAAVSPDAPVHLVGHDWGSVQSWAFVADPSLEGRIASFTSISGPSLDLTGRWLRRAWRSPRRWWSVLRQGLRSSYVWFFQLPVVPELVWRTGGDRLSSGVYAVSGVDDPRRHVAHTARTDGVRGVELYRQNVLGRFARPRLGPDARIDVPVQLIVPARDPFLLPALYEDLHETVPDLVRRDVPAGHWVPLTHPEALARWIDEHIDAVRHPEAPRRRGLRRGTATPDGPGRSPLADAVVVITGAGRGIGRAAAVAFAEHGAALVLTDVDTDGLARTAELAADVGSAGVEVHRLDVTDRAATEALAIALDGTVGVPDVVVLNAGVGAAGPFLDTTLEDWERTMAVNVDGVANGCAVFGRRLRDRAEGGAIVTVASAAAYLPSRATPVYGTSKAAVLALSANLRAELAPHGVSVSAVCPGIVDTPILTDTTFAGADDPDAVRTAMAALYRRRGFPPERVADAIVGAAVSGRAVVPVTAEARAAWVGAHLTPGLLRRLARIDPTATAVRLRS